MSLLHRLYHNSGLWYWSVFIFALIGLLVSVYLWYGYSQPQSISCTLVLGCEQVRQSDFSKFAGIDIPVYGFLFYLGLCVLVLLQFVPRRIFAWESSLLLFYGLAGVMVSVILTGIEIFVIQAICQWCLLSAIITVVVFISILRARYLSKK